MRKSIIAFAGMRSAVERQRLRAARDALLALPDFVLGECLKSLLPCLKRLPVAPNGSQRLPSTCNTRCLWLPMAPNDFHHVSLLPNYYP